MSFRMLIVANLIIERVIGKDSVRDMLCVFTSSTEPIARFSALFRTAASLSFNWSAESTQATSRWPSVEWVRQKAI